MIEKGIGGGNTITGLHFEKKVDLLKVFARMRGYSVKGHKIFYKDREVAISLKKNALYIFLKLKGVDYSKIISKKWLPDEALLVLDKNKLFVIEMKFQKVAGSVDEKLQTCDFKKKTYKKLLAPLNMDIEYIYILSDWFKHPRYKDTLDYVVSMDCKYYFEFLPLDELGLPRPKISVRKRN